MHRYFVTGTDTDVGKTRVTAMLATTLRQIGQAPAIVKLVQTGLAPGEPGDAARAGELAGVRYHEFERFTKAADPWSAALSQGAPAPRARDLAVRLDAIEGAVVAEGSGGLAVPLNAGEHFGHVVVLARLEAIVVVGMRLGCLNHALLTVALCRQLGIAIAGGVLVERWGPTGRAYRDDVLRTLQGKLRILGIVPFATDEASSLRCGANIFDPLVNG